jgi:hypothetical protein
MADVKTVRGTLHGATVETSEENATRLGAMFEPEKKSAAKKSSSSKSEK